MEKAISITAAITNNNNYSNRQGLMIIKNETILKLAEDWVEKGIEVTKREYEKVATADIIRTIVEVLGKDVTAEEIIKNCDSISDLYTLVSMRLSGLFDSVMVVSVMRKEVPLMVSAVVRALVKGNVTTEGIVVYERGAKYDKDKWSKVQIIVEDKGDYEEYYNKLRQEGPELEEVD